MGRFDFEIISKLVFLFLSTDREKYGLGFLFNTKMPTTLQVGDCGIIKTIKIKSMLRLLITSML